MLVKTFAGSVHGVDAQTITVEINTGGAVGIQKNQAFSLSDYPTAPYVKAFRIEAALKNSGIQILPTTQDHHQPRPPAQGRLGF